MPHDGTDIAPVTGMSHIKTRIVWILTLALPVLAVAASGSQTHPLDDLRRTAEQVVLEQVVAGDGARTLASAAAVDSRLRLARCATALEGVIPSTVRDAARMTVGVRCTQPAWTVYVPVSIETEMQVLVLRQAAARGASLTTDDVELQTRRVPGVAAGYLTDPAQLHRRHLKTAAGPGTALTPDLLAPDVMIKRGQRVTLVAAAGGIEVLADGEAIANGTAGGRVRVLNLSSHRIVEGRVESAERVRVGM